MQFPGSRTMARLGPLSSPDLAACPTPARAEEIRRDDRGLGPGPSASAGVTPLDDMSVEVRVRHVRADRAQRRRQDDVLQRPQRVRAPRRRERHGRSARTCCSMAHLPPGALGSAPHVPDRSCRRIEEPDGLRRTSTRMIHEHSKLVRALTRRRRGARRDRDRVGLDDADPQTKVGTLGAQDGAATGGGRRGHGRRPPKAGAARRARRRALPDAETAHLGKMIREIPEHTGALTILVDHDMSLVSSCCSVTAVLDFGKMMASGPTAAVLRPRRTGRPGLSGREPA